MSLIKTGHHFKKEFIFIHIPKTGGTSIKSIIGETGSHFTINEIIENGQDSLGVKFDINEKLPLVYFVRNPFDRLVSAYHYVVESEKVRLPKFFNTFDDFVGDFLSLITPYDHYYIENEDKINYLDPDAIAARHELLWKCQSIYVQSPEDMLHYRYRFETLEKGFHHFVENFIGSNTNIKLPHLNKRKRKRKPYQEHYKNKKTYEKVCEFYNEDFINFNYSKAL